MAREKSLFTSPRCGNPLLLSTLLIHLLFSVHSCSGATYKSYDIMGDLVCNRFHKRERTVAMMSPIIVESRSKTIANLTTGPALSCNFEAEAKGGNRLGVIAVVQKMKFRSQGDFCVDYIQSIYHKKKGFKVKHKRKDLTRKIIKKIITGDRNRRDSDGDDDTGPRICGDVLFGLHVDDNSTLPPPFAAPLPPLPPTHGSLLHSIVSDAMRVNPYRTLASDAADVDPRGELQIHIFLSNRALRVNETIDIRIVYTAYQECDGRSVPADLFHCGYGVCISSSLVNDGIVNCPFGDCIDETNCTNAKDSNVTAHIVKYSPAKSSGWSTWTKIIVVFIVCCIVAICGGAYYFMKKRRQQKKANVSEEQDNEDDDDGEGKQQPNAGAYYPPPPPGVPAYTPPPGVQPGYYPLIQQPPPPPGYSAVYPQQQDTAMGQGLPPPQQGYPMQHPTVGYMPPQATGPPASYPSYPAPGYPGGGPPPPSGDAPLYPTSAPTVQQQPPAPLPPSGPVGFTYPPPGSGYPQYPPSTGDAGPPPAANV